MSPDGTISLRGLHHDLLPPPTISPPRSALPVVLSIAHSGRDYPDWLLASAWAGRTSLEPLEDPLVDRLAWRALTMGCGAVIARCPRAAIDCNRAEDELDPAIIDGAPIEGMSRRARGGLGTVPSRTHAHGRLWRRPLRWAEFEWRLDQAHRPFHQALHDMIVATLEHAGAAMLLDLHSMPPRLYGPPLPHVVIGDRHGTSADPWVTRLAADIARGAGFSVALNDPFAGGHIVAQHGKPESGVHALQIEVARTAYCLKDCRNPGPGFERVAGLLERLAVELGSALTTTALAAE